MKNFKIYAYLIMSPLFNCLIAQTEQDFTKQYEFILMNNDYHDAQFTCLTEKILPHGAGSQIYVAGSLGNPANEWKILIERINLNGDEVAKRVIDPAGEDGKYIPTAILYERVGVNNDDVVTICGYINDPADGHAFVLRYNVTTISLEWMTQLEYVSSFFDLQKYRDDYIVCGQQRDDNQVASTFIVNKTTGAVSRFEQFDWTYFAILTTTSYYALEVNNETDEVALSSRVDYGADMADNFRMKPAISIIDNLAVHTYDKYFFGNASSVSRLYGFDIAWNTTNNILFTIASGDVDGNTQNADPYIIKHNTITNATNIRLLDFEEDFNGKLNSLKLYNKIIVLPGGATIIKNYPIIYGCKANNDILGDVYLVKLNATLNTVDWSRTYLGIFQPATTPNSMILIGNTVYAVGAKNAGTHDNAVLIASPIITDPSFCGEIYEPELQTPEPIVYSASFHELEIDVPQSEVEVTQPSIYSQPLPYLCVDDKVAPRADLNAIKESLIISNLSDQDIEFKISGANETSNYRIQIVNLLGQVIIDKQMEDDHSLLANMESGVFICCLFKDGVQIENKKFICN